MMEAQGATTKVEVRAAMKAVWKRVTPEHCVNVSKRIRRHMLKVIESKGGNFYHE